MPALNFSDLIQRGHYLPPSVHAARGQRELGSPGNHQILRHERLLHSYASLDPRLGEGHTQVAGFTQLVIVHFLKETEREQQYD